MKQLNFGLIGCGDLARKRIAPAMRDLKTCRLLAVNRARHELAGAFAREFGAARWYRTWRELLADKEVDAVYIATPHDQHAEQAIAAADAGKHVLCEKPMALKLEDCRAMIDACRRNHVKLGVAYYRHFYPVVKRVKALVQSGKLGVISSAQAKAFGWHDWSKDATRPWLQSKTESGGGPMMGYGCHRLEVLINILGPVKRASGYVHNAVFDLNIEDTAAALLQFEGGANGILNVSDAVFESVDTVDIYGSKGAAHIGDLNRGDLVIRTADGEQRESHPPHANLQLPLIEDFVDAVLNDSAPQVGGDIGYAVQKVLDEIYTGR